MLHYSCYEAGYKILVFFGPSENWLIRVVDPRNPVYGYWEMRYDEYSGYDGTYNNPAFVDALLNKYHEEFIQGE